MFSKMFVSIHPIFLLVVFNCIKWTYPLIIHNILFLIRCFQALCCLATSQISPWILSLWCNIYLNANPPLPLKMIIFHWKNPLYNPLIGFHIDNVVVLELLHFFAVLFCTVRCVTVLYYNVRCCTVLKWVTLNAH